MLSHADNETLCRVGPGTAMGALMRLFWIPCYPSDKLKADDRPRRIKLLGEDLVAWRDSEGRAALSINACPHRGAPMMYARNEQCGLRCVYHGWKFDHEGKVADMPAEPERSRMRDRVRLKTYRTQERNGVVWAYLGPEQESPPPLPDIEWNLVPQENVHLSWRVQECNWLQAMEGEIDSAHAAILHGRIDNKGAINAWTAARDLRPVFECRPQPFGMSVASKRKGEDGSAYWRVNQFMMPFWTLVPPHSKFPELSGHAWVPIDDNHTLCLMFSYVPHHPMYPRSKELFEQGHQGRETGHASLNCYVEKPPSTPYAEFWTKFTPGDDYLFNYEAQRDTWFSGLPGLWVQDAACQSGLMPIYDRTQENLGVSDTGIAMTRRLLLETVAALRDHGTRPAGATRPETFMARAIAVHLPPEARWYEAAADVMQARPGQDFGYVP